jgi:ribosome-associated translation inhibitor RaiA
MSILGIIKHNVKPEAQFDVLKAYAEQQSELKAFELDLTKIQKQLTRLERKVYRDSQGVIDSGTPTDWINQVVKR